MTSGNSAKQAVQLDVKKIFYEKNPKLAPLIPGFIYRYIRKIVHEDFLNGFMERHGHKDGLGFINGAISEFEIKLIIKGEENIPANGRFLFASNHPLGGFDGILLIYYLRKHFDTVKFLVNDILMNIPNYDEFFVPINKHGGQSRESARIIDQVYSSDDQIITFPSGYVSRKIKGVVQDLPWQKSFIAKSIAYKREIIPIHVSGENTKFFYRLANFRKFLGLKWNLEMFYLPDESYRHKGKTITISFGKPIPFTTFDKSLTHMEWAARVRELVYTLPTEKPISLTPQI